MCALLSLGFFLLLVSTIAIATPPSIDHGRSQLLGKPQSPLRAFAALSVFGYLDIDHSAGDRHILLTVIFSAFFLLDQLLVIDTTLPFLRVPIIYFYGYP